MTCLHCFYSSDDIMSDCFNTDLGLSGKRKKVAGCCRTVVSGKHKFYTLGIVGDWTTISPSSMSKSSSKKFSTFSSLACAGQLSVLQYLSVGENYLSFLPEVRELAAGGVQKHRKLQPDSFSGDWVIGGP